MKSFIKLAVVAALSFFAASGVFADRKDWSSVAAPQITKIEQTGPNEITVSFKALTADDGADKGSVTMSGAASSTKTFGKTRKEEKTAVFEVKKSGTLTFSVTAERNGESAKHTSAEKTYEYKLPLVKTPVSISNVGDGKLKVEWESVNEADGYVVYYLDEKGKQVSQPKTTSLSTEITLPVGTVTNISVGATRGKEEVRSDGIKKTARADAERVWKFTEFGTSTKAERNNMEMLDSDNLKVKLNSCIFDPETQKIIEKGGKFESFFDGLSFYYTVIDPKKENWELTATVTVDYHNPAVDGQEGFGLIAMDKLGIDGEPMVVAYTNSAGIISKKFTTHVNGSKKEIKNGLGARFVTGLTDEVIKLGDAGISQMGTSRQQAFSYDQNSDAIKTGDVYRITLKKDNTGYHAIYKREIASEDTVEEFILYDPDNNKLLQLDKEHVYVGLAVARGVNATFSDIVFKTSDPKTDPPAQEEPPELVPLATLIDCPPTYYKGSYPFVFHANAKGKIHVETKDGKVLVNSDDVEADKDYKKTLNINSKGLTDLLVTFDPEDGWRPEPKKVIAQYNSELKDYEQNYKAVTYTHSISIRSLKGKKLYVSTEGNAFGDGSKAKPFDLITALNFSRPGQEIIMLPGTYMVGSGITIERGNDGTPSSRKILRSDKGARAVLDFSRSGLKASGSGFNLYGSYWTFENFDITGTPDNVKALQVAGNYNIVKMVDTYLNGDTGLQIAGRSSEPFEKWPHDNIIYGCESFGNADPAENNADGFAAKLTVGNNNVFRNCVSHHNVDDGWDLYAKVETGPIGATLLENCITYANGTRLDGSGHGDGNGFKMGGDGINVPHILKNSITWGNGVNGVTCNSNPGLQLDHVISAFNGAYGIALYGKGKAEAYPRTFKTAGVVSFANGQGDNLKEPNEFNKDQVSDPSNYFFNGAGATNVSGTVLKEKDNYVSIDIEKYKNGYNADKTFNRIPRDENGVFQLGDLFKLSSGAIKGAGADYNNLPAFKMPSGNNAVLPIILVVIFVICLSAGFGIRSVRKKSN
ncbi:MAG: pectate lyase [Treponema sp.]|nr:pectate lyase [Treponema sp.]